MKIKKGRGMGKGCGKGMGTGPRDGSGCGRGNGTGLHDGPGCGCGNDENRSSQDRHLANLGFVEGAKIEVVSVTNGNFIVKVKDSKIGIGRDIAKKIMVG